MVDEVLVVGLVGALHAAFKGRLLTPRSFRVLLVFLRSQGSFHQSGLRCLVAIRHPNMVVRLDAGWAAGVSQTAHSA